MRNLVDTICSVTDKKNLIKIRFFAYEDTLKNNSKKIQNIRFGYDDQKIFQYVSKKRQDRTFLLLDLNKIYKYVL